MTRETIFEILGKLCRDGIGRECLWEFALNSLMRHERSEWLAVHPEGGNKGNGFRPRAVHIGGVRYAVRISRDRRGLFRPFLLEFLRLQDEAQEGIVSRLYACGMTTRDIGATLRDIYGRAYAPSSVSRMLEATAADVEAWLARPLPPRVPVLYIDCLHARVARGGTVAPEAFYVALGVLPDGRREVLGIGSRPTEGAGGWARMLEGLRARGLGEVGVVVADGLKGLGDAVAATLPGCALQRCTVHLRRNCLDEVRKGDRARMREDLDRLLRAGDPGYTPAQGWREWGDFLARWARDYAHFRRLQGAEAYRDYLTHLRFAPAAQRALYSTNWIERLNRLFRRALRPRGHMPSAEVAVRLLARVAMECTGFYQRPAKGLMADLGLFPSAADGNSPRSKNFSPDGPTS